MKFVRQKGFTVECCLLTDLNVIKFIIPAFMVSIMTMLIANLYQA